MTERFSLETLFRIQDQAANYNRESSTIVQRRLQFVDDAVQLACSVLTSMQFLAHKQTVLRVFCTDTISSIVTSVRVGLSGNLPDSIALLRSALESCAILGAAVETQDFQVGTAEMQASRLKKYSYDDAVGRLGEVGSRIKSHHGRLSNIGAHSTGTRMKFASYEWNGERYDRLGAAYEPESAELALSLVPDVCLYLLESLERAYVQDCADFPFADSLRDLTARFSEVKSWSTETTA